MTTPSTAPAEPSTLQARILTTRFHLHIHPEGAGTICETCATTHPHQALTPELRFEVLTNTVVSASQGMTAKDLLVAYRTRCDVCAVPTGIVLGPDEDIDAAKAWLHYGIEDPEGGWAAPPAPNRAARRAAHRS